MSSDSDVESFNQYFGKMPWTSLPTLGSSAIKQSLADSLKISGIPALVVLDAKTGHFISDNARFDVSNAHGNEVKCEALIDTWKKTEAVPIEEAQLSGSGSDGFVL
jgi:nucleoredoxin